MAADSFLDTNVWVYAVSGSPAEQDKKIKALRLIATPGTALSVQVLQEFYVAVTRKLQQPLSGDEARAWVAQMRQLPCASVTPALVERAIEISLRYQLSYWDGGILAAAGELGVARLYSEDLSHGQLYEGIRVVNPFLS